MPRVVLPLPLPSVGVGCTECDAVFNPGVWITHLPAHEQKGFACDRQKGFACDRLRSAGCCVALQPLHISLLPTGDFQNTFSFIIPTMLIFYTQKWGPH